MPHRFTPDSRRPDRPAGSRGRGWVTVVIIVAFLMPIALLTLSRRSPSPVPLPAPPVVSAPSTPAAPETVTETRDLPETIRELYHRAGLLLERIHAVTPDAADLLALEDLNRQLPSIEDAFGKLLEDQRGPAKAAARSAQAAFNGPANAVFEHTDASAELRALTEELRVGLNGLAAGGNRIEEVLSSAYGQAVVVLLKVRADSMSESAAADRLHRYSDQVARLVPAYGVIEEDHRVRVRKEAQRQWKLFAPLAAAATNAATAGEQFRLLNSELLSMLREFTR